MSARRQSSLGSQLSVLSKAKRQRQWTQDPPWHKAKAQEWGTHKPKKRQTQQNSLIAQGVSYRTWRREAGYWGNGTERCSWTRSQVLPRRSQMPV
jgi:hypothetical protein